jgi:hypothetical protein
MIWKLENLIKSYTTRNRGLCDWKTKPKTNQFDHLFILDKLIWTRPTWLMVFFTYHRMVFLTNQIKQKFGQSKKINQKNQIVNIKYVNNKYRPTHPWPAYPQPTYVLYIHTYTRYIYKYTYST